MATSATRTIFHEGERAVQRRAGVEQVAAKVGRNILASIPDSHAEFLRERAFVVVAARDAAGRLWGSLLVSGAGFAHALDERRLLLAAAPSPADPLAPALDAAGLRIGILAIEFDTRTRIRLNGVSRPTPEGIVIDVEEAFGNCPKFIQRRLPTNALPVATTRHSTSGTALAARQTALVRKADTFFIASAHPQRGADASHRGGRPGFVDVSSDGRRLRFPDYTGNRMFQTLGNIAVDPRVGLLFLDWETGSALQLTGHAQIVWDAQQIATWPGAERLVDVEVDGFVEQQGAMPARWTLVEPSPLNPPLNR